jgi:hypothetical protein
MAKSCHRDCLTKRSLRVFKIFCGKKLSLRLSMGKKLVVCVVFSKKFVYGNELSKSFHRGCL